MYQRFAAVYDAIYGFKNYAEEAEKIEDIVRAKSPNARTLLDVACGSGEHIRHLKDKFTCIGVDLSEDLIAVSREKLPDVEFLQGDMRTFDLGRSVDVVTCLFGAVGYMLSKDELWLAITNMAKHLSANGVLIVEPWLDKHSYKEGYYTLMTAETDTMKIARANTTKRDGDHSIIEFHFLVADANGTEHFTEIHRMGLFSKEDYLAAFSAAGLVAKFDEKGLMGRGLYLATRT